MIHFSSDLHLSHKNIIKYCNRPCTEEEHNQWIMSKFDHLKSGDILYLLGDISCNFRIKLQEFIKFFTYFKDKGVLVYIALGNHDEKFANMIMQAFQQVYKLNPHKYINHYFCLRDVKISDSLTTRITMSHYPLGSWDQSHRGSINLFGHCHGTYKDRKKFQYDVGLDVEHKVFSLDDIIEKYHQDIEDEKV